MAQQVAVVSHLLERGADPNMVKHNMDGALHWACYRGDAAIGWGRGTLVSSHFLLKCTAPQAAQSYALVPNPNPKPYCVCVCAGGPYSPLPSCWRTART